MKTLQDRRVKEIHCCSKVKRIHWSTQYILVVVNTVSASRIARVRKERKESLLIRTTPYIEFQRNIKETDRNITDKSTDSRIPILESSVTRTFLLM